VTAVQRQQYHTIDTNNNVSKWAACYLGRGVHYIRPNTAGGGKNILSLLFQFKRLTFITFAISCVINFFKVSARYFKIIFQHNFPLSCCVVSSVSGRSGLENFSLLPRSRSVGSNPLRCAVPNETTGSYKTSVRFQKKHHTLHTSAMWRIS
jgi:hypothetical protein